MGRVNRLMERRALRRAADQALLTSLGNAAPSRAGGAPDQDFEYTRSEPTESAAFRDHEPTTEPIPIVAQAVPDRLDDHAWDNGAVAADPFGVPAPEFDAGELPPEPADVYDLVPERPGAPEWDDAGEMAATEQAVTGPPDDYGWDARDDLPPKASSPAPPLRARPLVEAAYVQPALDFARADYRDEAWYRTKPAAAVLVAAVIAAVLCGGWLVFRSPNTNAEQSNEAPTSAPPAPSKAAPTAVSAPKPPPAPPPPPPPPPPPSAEPTYSAPQRQYSPRYSEPTTAEKPRVDVTRAPMSVAPVPKPVPGSDSSIPGNAPGKEPRRRGCFGFC